MAEVMKYDDFKEEGSETAVKVSPLCLVLENCPSPWRGPVLTLGNVVVTFP